MPQLKVPEVKKNPKPPYNADVNSGGLNTGGINWPNFDLGGGGGGGGGGNNNLNIPSFNWGDGPNLNFGPTPDLTGGGGGGGLNLDDGLGNPNSSPNLNLDTTDSPFFSSGGGGGLGPDDETLTGLNRMSSLAPELDLNDNGILDSEESATGGSNFGGGLDSDGNGIPDARWVAVSADRV